MRYTLISQDGPRDVPIRASAHSDGQKIVLEFQRLTELSLAAAGCRRPDDAGAGFAQSALSDIAHQSSRRSDLMPRFAANLAYLFTERPLIERFGAAAAAGFKAVELQFPYDHAPSAVRAELEKHGLTQLGVNTAVGGARGRFRPRRRAGPRARLGGGVQAGARLHGRDRRQRDPLHDRQGAAGAAARGGEDLRRQPRRARPISRRTRTSRC